MVGTDYPYELGDWMAAEKIQRIDCKDSERDAMLFGNAKRLLKMTA
jgi:predicted TIM-barrel fold metal-dependent hydrolase